MLCDIQTMIVDYIAFYYAKSPRGHAAPHAKIENCSYEPHSFV